MPSRSLAGVGTEGPPSPFLDFLLRLLGYGVTGRRDSLRLFSGSAGCERRLVRVDGIEPTQPAWKAGVLPLNYTR